MQNSKTVRKNIIFPEKLISRFNVVNGELGVNFSTFVRIAIEEKIEHLEKLKLEKELAEVTVSLNKAMVASGREIAISMIERGREAWVKSLTPVEVYNLCEELRLWSAELGRNETYMDIWDDAILFLRTVCRRKKEKKEGRRGDCGCMWAGPCGKKGKKKKEGRKGEERAGLGPGKEKKEKEK